MKLDEILERARSSMHSAAWGDVAKALVDMFPELPCGMEGASVIGHDDPGDLPYVRIGEEAVGTYEPDEARAYAATVIRAADDADAARRLMPNI